MQTYAHQQGQGIYLRTTRRTRREVAESLHTTPDNIILMPEQPNPLPEHYLIAKETTGDYAVCYRAPTGEWRYVWLPVIVDNRWYTGQPILNTPTPYNNIPPVPMFPARVKEILARVDLPRPVHVVTIPREQRIPLGS